MNHQQVAHIWAQQGKDATGCNMFSRGGTIYSYGRHFPIAKFVEFSVILFTTQGYSVSTAKHITYTRRAIPSHATVFDVENVEATTKTSHKANYRHYLKTIEIEALRVSRARLYNDVDTLNVWISEANDYSKMFKLGFKVMPPVALEDIGPMTEKSRAKAKRDAAKAKQVRLKLDKKRAADAANRLLTLISCLPLWIGGATVFPQGISPYNLSEISGSSYLRVKNGTTAETNQGAEVPLKHCKRAWPLIQRIVEKGENWHSNGHSIHLGQFSIDSISTTGTIKAGCHTFSYSELARFARVIGV